MKIDPSEVRVVLAGPMLCPYRDRTLIEETDSLNRPTGILHACGLYRFIDRATWIPGKFSFRKENARPAQLPIEGDHLLPWLMAGVIIGERTVRYSKTSGIVSVAPGRLIDQEFAAKIWRDWLSWRIQGSQGTFARFTLRKTKLRFGEDEPIHKIVQRLGLSVS